MIFPPRYYPESIWSGDLGKKASYKGSPPDSSHFVTVQNSLFPFQEYLFHLCHLTVIYCILCIRRFRKMLLREVFQYVPQFHPVIIYRLSVPTAVLEAMRTRIRGSLLF